MIRRLYNWASDARFVRGPIGAVRAHPRVRAFARRHVDVLLQRGGTWANVDGALRLLAEDERGTVVFEPWPGDTATELLYWVPFVRWAQSHFALDPARLVAVSRGGVEHWYADACRGYVEAGAATPGDAARFPAAPVHALVEEYRRGAAPPRPLLKRALHARLSGPADPITAGLPERYVVLAEPLEVAQPVVILHDVSAEVPPERRRRAQHAVLARAAGVVGDLDVAVLAALSGVPAIALRPPARVVVEPDVDMALRVASELSAPLTDLAPDALNRLFTSLGPATRRGTVESIP
jgi:hypothetical protein